MSKKCVECGAEFVPYHQHYQKVCSNSCRRERNRKYNKTRYQLLRSGRLEKQKRYYDEWKKQHPGESYQGIEYKMYYGARERAKKSGVEFTISLSDIVVPEVCPILKHKLQKGTRYAPSLDRIDSSKGYTPKNIWVISKIANRMKNDATEEELKRFGYWAIKQTYQT